MRTKWGLVAKAARGMRVASVRKGGCVRSELKDASFRLSSGGRTGAPIAQLHPTPVAFALMPPEVSSTLEDLFSSREDSLEQQDFLLGEESEAGIEQSQPRRQQRLRNWPMVKRSARRAMRPLSRAEGALAPAASMLKIVPFFRRIVQRDGKANGIPVK